MDSFETSRNAFELTSATWEYFQNGYKAKIKLERGVYEGYVNDVFIDSTVEFVPLCNRLITEIRRREEKFRDQIGNLSVPAKSKPPKASGN